MNNLESTTPYDVSVDLTCCHTTCTDKSLSASYVYEGNKDLNHDDTISINSAQYLNSSCVTTSWNCPECGKTNCGCICVSCGYNTVTITDYANGNNASVTD